MHTESYDEFEKNVLIPFFKYYNKENLQKMIDVKRYKFEQGLDEAQKEEFEKLWELFDDYCEVVRSDAFCDGLFKSKEIEKENT